MRGSRMQTLAENKTVLLWARGVWKQTRGVDRAAWTEEQTLVVGALIRVVMDPRYRPDLQRWLALVARESEELDAAAVEGEQREQHTSNDLEEEHAINALQERGQLRWDLNQAEVQQRREDLAARRQGRGPADQHEREGRHLTPWQRRVQTVMAGRLVAAMGRPLTQPEADDLLEQVSGVPWGSGASSGAGGSPNPKQRGISRSTGSESMTSDRAAAGDPLPKQRARRRRRLVMPLLLLAVGGATVCAAVKRG